MDLSGNKQIDFLYLTNPNILDKYKRSIPEKTRAVTDEDIKFYRKRILLVTKNYLRGEKLTNEITGAFECYADQLIKHFKFIDKTDMVQKEYENLSKKKSSPATNFKLMNQNKLMMRDKKNTVKTIKDFLPIVVKEKTKKKMVIPKQKNYNIKNPILRSKGVKNK